jgi:chemotaxis protein histidine kinase CheA/methylmalonyl-CoA mutase cobalamin-binding subunit
MFLDEVGERSDRLIEGGQAMQRGNADADMAATMLREGHTIKGTARVMGFEAISTAGKMIEDLWRGVKSGDIEPYPNLGRALVTLAESLMGATKADPDTGTPEMIDAMEKLNRATGYILGEDPGTGSGGGSGVEQTSEPSVAPEPPSGPDAEARIADVVPLPGLGEADGTVDLRDGQLAATSTEDSPEREPAPPPVAPPEPDVAPPEPAPESAQPGTAAAEPQQPTEPSPPTVVPHPPTESAVADPTADQPIPPAPTLRQGVVSARSVPLESTAGEVIGSAAPDEPEVYGPDLGGLLSSLENWASGQSIQVSAGRLYRLINYVASMRVELDSLLAEMRYSTEVTINMIEHMSDLVKATSSLEMNAMELGAVPVRQMTNTLPQLVRYLAKKLGKEIRFEIAAADDLDVDRQVLDKISDPVRQLIVNSVNHGIEAPGEREAAGKAATGTISVSLARHGSSFEVVVADDGAGVDYDLVRQLAVSQGLVAPDAPTDPDMLRPILFFPGFTTKPGDELNSVGAGLSSVADAVESLYGRIRIESKAGAGTTVTLIVPTVRDLQRVLIVDSGGVKWGIPEAVIEVNLPIADADIRSQGDRQLLMLDGNEIPLAPIANVVGATDSRSPIQVVAISHRAGIAAVTVNEVLGIREVAAKELGPVVSGPGHITGAALMGGGDVVLVLDAGAVVQLCQAVPKPMAPRSRILVVDDSQGARAVIAGSLASSGFGTSVAESAFEALEILGEQHVDALVVDFSMPAQDGVELARKVREAGVQIPIVMLSGVAKPEDQQRALEAGVNAFFEKADFREGALATMLRDLLGIS